MLLVSDSIYSLAAKMVHEKRVAVGLLLLVIIVALLKAVVPTIAGPSSPPMVIEEESKTPAPRREAAVTEARSTEPSSNTKQEPAASPSTPHAPGTMPAPVAGGDQWDKYIHLNSNPAYREANDEVSTDPAYPIVHHPPMDLKMTTGRVFLKTQNIAWPSIKSLSSKTNIVVGMWHYARPDKRLIRFCKSLRAAGSDAAIVLFAQPGMLNRTTPVMVEYNVSLLEYWGDLMIAQKYMWVSSLRYILADLLFQRFPFFKAGMISDVRDVVFQLDPFSYVYRLQQATGKTIVAAGEVALINGTVDNIDFGITHGLIWRCYGLEYANTMIGLRVMCSGTTLGTFPDFGEYMTAMSHLSRRHFQCSKIARDQGVHNVLLYRNESFTSKVNLETETTGRIMTMHGVTTLRFDPDSLKALNEYGLPYIVTHQIPRCKGFVKSSLVIDEPLPNETVHSDKFRKIKFTNSSLDGCTLLNTPPYLDLGDLHSLTGPSLIGGATGGHGGGGGGRKRVNKRSNVRTKNQVKVPAG